MEALMELQASWTVWCRTYRIHSNSTGTPQERRTVVAL
ncbi:hypothetical protein TNCV_1505021, partial [Trichonephila clavipes]